MNIDKKFFVVPAILAAICVGAAGLIGGANALTKDIIYQNENKVEVTPEMQAMYPGASFEHVATFPGLQQAGQYGYTANVRFAYRVASENAYVFDVRGETAKGTVKIYVSFRATSFDDITMDKVVLYEHSDAGYKAKAQAFVDSLNGNYESANVSTGATLSCKCIIDEINVAKQALIIAVFGGDAVVVDYRLIDAKKLYQGKDVARKEGFTSYTSTQGYTVKGKKTEFPVTLLDCFVVSENGTEVATLYRTNTCFSPEDSPLNLSLWISFSGTATEENKTTYAPSMVTVYASEHNYYTPDMGHSEADINAYGNDIVTGTATTNANGRPTYTYDGCTIYSGASMTGNCVFYSVVAARADYVQDHIA